MTSDDTGMSGEGRLKARRAQFYRYLALAFLGAALIGFASGLLVAQTESGAVLPWIMLAVAGVTALVFAWFTRDYFRRIDELDLMDNLWAHTTGLYGGMIVFALWFLLSELGLSGAPNAAGVVVSMLLITFATYGLRKLGLR